MRRLRPSPSHETFKPLLVLLSYASPLRRIASNVRVKGEVIRVRNHVNPLSVAHAATPTLNPSEIISNYRDINRPLWLDIGCGRGDYLRPLARELRSWNVLGLEIREPMVQHASERRILPLSSLT